MRVAEIELGEVAVQVGRGNVVVCPDNAALEDAEKALNRVGVRIATNVFLGGMIDGLMRFVFLADRPVDAAFICAEV